MHEEVIDTLDFPRERIRHSLDLEDCPHAGHYDHQDGECHRCESDEMCLWILRNDNKSVLREKSLAELIRALEFSITYIDTRVSDLDHNYKNCACDACDWLREAYKLFNRALATRPLV